MNKMLYGVIFSKKPNGKKWEWISASVNTIDRLESLLNTYRENNPEYVFKLEVSEY